MLFVATCGVTGMVILLLIRGFKRWRKWSAERRGKKLSMVPRPGIPKQPTPAQSEAPAKTSLESM